jgi:hypothetical protein
MPRIGRVCAALSLTLLACTHRGPAQAVDQPAPASPEQGERPSQATVAAQEAVTRAFHATVTPKLRACWDRLQGEGSIEMAFTYVASSGGGGWELENVEPIKATLPEEQVAAAVRCMQESARGMSLTLPPDDGSKAYEKLVLKWTWLVPLPPEGSEALARRAADEDPPRGCAKCISNYPARCQWSASGEADCRVDGPSQCSTSGTKCLGGLYGMAGNGLVIF